MQTNNYDYYEEVYSDITVYIEENIDVNGFESREALEKYIIDEILDSDVTGSANTSYTLNRYIAEEYLCHNLYLLSEVLEECGIDGNMALSSGAEYCDVLIRCYLVPPLVSKVLDDMNIK